MNGTPPLGADDNDRTVIRPSPGGRLPPTAPAAAARTWADAPANPEPETCPVINTPLAVAATPLLQLLARLQNTLRPPHPGELRERVVQEFRAFERRARQAGIAPDVLQPTHYALCASIDDVVLNTPWGAAGDWHGRMLVSVFHRGAGGSSEFFEILHRIKQDPEKFLPVIEVMYLCLSLGYMGQYRPPRGNAAGFDQLRNEICGLIIRHRQTADADLSPRWQGIRAPYRAARRRLPVWVAVVAAVAAGAACFVFVSDELNMASDNAYARLLAAPPGHMPRISRVAHVQLPAAPPPVEPDALDRLRGLLKAEIGTGHVSVAGTASSPMVRIYNRGLFPPRSAALQPSAVPMLEHIGAALKSEPGSVRVVGYTDNQPVHTVLFASNFQLSLARARAVGAVLADALGDAGRVSADGRADADPIGSNATADGRELNRRTEIVLHHQDQQD